MLTESVSDPRRANWLTISSMSEDLCWPEDSETSSRPSWELEAEILRLTTRLMMRERELQQAKSQLKSQTSRSQQQLSTLCRQMEEQEEKMRLLLLQKDEEMQAIVSQLLLFEAELRQEQTRIETLLSDKDKRIQKQQEEIEQLRGAVRSHESTQDGESSTNTNCLQETGPPAHTCAIIEDNISQPSPVESWKKFLPSTNAMNDSDIAVKKLKDGLIRIRAIQDLTNVRSTRPDKTLVPETRICENLVLNEKRRVPHKTPQKMKDLKAKRVNTAHKSHYHHHHRPVMAGELCGQVIL